MVVLGGLVRIDSFGVAEVVGAKLGRQVKSGHVFGARHLAHLMFQPCHDDTILSKASHVEHSGRMLDLWCRFLLTTSNVPYLNGSISAAFQDDV